MMKTLLLALCLLLAPLAAQAGTITITSAGFGALPASPPAGWPANVTWPGNGILAPNGSRAATITDAEMLQLFTWAAASQFQGQGSAIAPVSPTIAQVLVAWIGTFFNGTKAAVQGYFTVPAAPPPPINLN